MHVSKTDSTWRVHKWHTWSLTPEKRSKMTAL